MSVAIWWVRRDLRLADNPALRAALEHGAVVPVYIHAPDEEAEATPGAASRWWLHHSLESLDAGLRMLGSRLVIRRASTAQEALDAILRETGAGAVFWNRQYAPSQLKRDKTVKSNLRARGVKAESFNGSLLFEPWTVSRDGKPYRVFTPFWKACQKHGLDQGVEPAPTALPAMADNMTGLSVGELGLLPSLPWSKGFDGRWHPGEAGAWQRLTHFVEHGLARYQRDRNMPGLDGSSSLSPHLHFGEIGPRQIIRFIIQALDGAVHDDALHFFSELGWREFGYHLLFHFPHMVDKPMDPRWEAFPWPEVDQRLWEAWVKGKTGIPLVDAGMRELWATGWMHNRVRMNAASLLTKNMLIPWQKGERWFWDTLVDADLANNVQGWQWTAGCGADAAPYFRIFNPTLQGERFDGGGEYVRRWVPELARLPDRWLHRPWEAPADVLRSAGIVLGVNYPRPVVDLGESRRQALARFSMIKKPEKANAA